MSIDHTIFNKIISIENLYNAWEEFKKGKRHKTDVIEFEYNLENNLFKLHWQLKNGYYKHGAYQKFNVHDPKPRVIHKATVTDRVVHHAIFSILCPIYDKTFNYDSYSCRINKGTHKAVKRLEKFTQNVSRNYRKSCFILKCDISKFFASIDHSILKKLIIQKIRDKKALTLISKIIDSFSSTPNKGLPLGNLTSQLFANIYLNELDQYIKHQLKIKYYIRYTDDFVLVSDNREFLRKIIPKIDQFLKQKLILFLHPQKIIIRKSNQGIDFLGYIVLPHHTKLRTKTKNRMFKKIKNKYKEYKFNKTTYSSLNQSLQSYYGMLMHCRGNRLKNQLNKIISNVLDR